jgi:O-antigen/teichoic acid export membrane protein
MLGINVISLIVLLPRWGIDGAGLAFFVSVIPVFFLFRYTEARVLGIGDLRRDWLALAGKNLLCGLIVFALGRFILAGLIGGLPSLLLVFCGTLCGYYLLYAGLRFVDPEDMRVITAYARVCLAPLLRVRERV